MPRCRGSSAPQLLDGGGEVGAAVAARKMSFDPGDQKLLTAIGNVEKRLGNVSDAGVSGTLPQLFGREELWSNLQR